MFDFPDIFIAVLAIIGVVALYQSLHLRLQQLRQDVDKLLDMAPPASVDPANSSSATNVSNS